MFCVFLVADVSHSTLQASPTISTNEFPQVDFDDSRSIKNIQTCLMEVQKRWTEQIRFVSQIDVLGCEKHLNKYNVLIFVSESLQKYKPYGNSKALYPNFYRLRTIKHIHHSYLFISTMLYRFAIRNDRISQMKLDTCKTQLIMIYINSSCV